MTESRSDHELLPIAAGAQEPATSFKAGIRETFHRVRYRTPLCLVERHVHVEALTIRSGTPLSTKARGVRFLFRSQPVEELPHHDRDRDWHPSFKQDFPPSWLDPVFEGPPDQATANVFIPLDEVAILTEGLTELVNTGDRWQRHGAYESAEWVEAVYALSDGLVFGIKQRQMMQDGFVEMRAPLKLYFPIPTYRLAELRTWLRRAQEELEKAP